MIVAYGAFGVGGPLALYAAVHGFPTNGWQLPYLRVSLILRRLDAQKVTSRGSRSPRATRIRERERRNLERARRAVIRAGWFN